MENNKNEKNNLSLPAQEAMRKEYEKYEDIRRNIVTEIKEYVGNLLKALNSNPVVSGRIKNFTSYYGKYLRFLKNNINNPVITDLLGIRIICPFIEDLSVTEEIIKKNFRILETERKGHYNFKEFGYESTHLLVKIPENIITQYGNPGTDILEIQIRTILQDAWAEVEHEIVYKAEFSPFDEPMRRKLAAVNASLSLADIIFQEIRSYQRKFSRELEKRRESFYNKIEESTDELLFAEETQKRIEPEIFDTGIGSVDTDKLSIDDLLVNALSAHNKNQFNEAINQYSKILELKPDNIIRSIIYKHRGMANFACSQYKEAIEDFTRALELDQKAYKAVYYRGVVNSVLKQYSNAIDDYTLALSINPYQSFCLFRRGQAYYHIGDYPQALSDCENSLALEPSNKSAIKFKALVIDKLKM
ncbi:MAG: tetratricopeptide repeat protein [Treponema sp.]|jgi:putative GTP pyrophosphokinase|nr:tetratricopeptide repeat protein [Treponema sp.]